MGQIISRSEASHRLKLIASHSNNAAGEARDGRWQEAVDALRTAMQMAVDLLPHLEEAAEDAELSGLPQPPRYQGGGLGYRGSSHGVGSLGYGQPPVRATPPPSAPIVSNTKPPEPFKRAAGVRPPRPIVTPPPAPRPIITPAPPPAQPRAIITPPPPSSEPVPPPQILTPPPPITKAPEPPREPLYEPARVSIFPVEYDDIPPLTFDPSRIEGLPAFDGSPMTEEERRVANTFRGLPEDMRRVITEQFDKTGKPVICKLRTEK